MESKISYTAVGAFVIVLGLALIYIIFWLTSSTSNKHYSTFLTYINESVTGLTVEATVKYNGVDVGFVKDISLNPKDPEQVRVVLQIDSSIPIHEDTTATLEVQGLTGVAFVGLRGGTAHSPILQAKANQRYPIIKSSPSLLGRLDTAMRELTANLDSITDSIKSVLDKDNLLALKNTLQNVSKVSQVLSDNSAKLNESLNNMNILLRNTSKASVQLPQLINTAQQDTDAIKIMASNLSNAGQEVSVTMRTSRSTINSISNQLMPQTIMLMQKLSSIATNLQSVSGQLKENPAIILRGTTGQALGPGEHR